MKVTKVISLDEETARIAGKMANFSQWCRIGLRAHALGEDLASETLRRIRWAKAAHMLASALNEQFPDQSVDDLLSKALNQTTLEEY
jgi:hypothetical protein